MFQVARWALRFLGVFPSTPGFRPWCRRRAMHSLRTALLRARPAAFRALPVFEALTPPYDVAAAVPLSDAASAIPPQPGNWQATLRDQIGTEVAVDDITLFVRKGPFCRWRWSM